MLRSLFPVLALLLVAGCGEEEPTRAGTPPREVELALDFTPNAVHAPIYAAVRERLDRKENIRLKIRTPGAGPDSLKLVATGKVPIGVLDIHDLAIARERDLDLVGVAAVVDKPLAALLAQPGIRRPRDLEGRTVGVSGLPSDPAFLRAIVEHDGGDYDRIRQVTIGFSAVARLLSRRVDAVPAFWNAEGIAAREKGLDVREFRVEEFGAPAYPEVVVITARRTLDERRADVEAAVRALAAGAEAAVAEPEETVRQIAEAAGTKDTRLVAAQLEAVGPLFADALRLDRAVLEQWADFDAEIGLVKERPDVARAFDFTVAGS